ncbi:MAG: hypothetical protein K5858_01570 [Lachnospiraceae bacterium]|nr:hypothetical protein [Lachnospiraceae bacterium]
MKKNSKNKKVIMALTMAINASMILNPVLAKAESLGDAPNSPDDNTVPVTPLDPTNEQSVLAPSATENALKAAEEAKEDTKEVLNNEGYSMVATGVVPAAEATKDVDEKFDDKADEAVSGINDTIDALEDAAFAEVKGNSAKRIAEGEASKANTAATEAEKYAAEYAKQVDALSEKIVGVEETIKSSNEAIDKATNVKDAQDAAKAAGDAFGGLKAIEDEISKAETNYNTESGKYVTAKDKYDKAVEAVDKASEEYAGLIDGAATGAAVTGKTLDDMRQELSNLKHQAEMNQNLQLIKETEERIVEQLNEGKTVVWNDSSAKKISDKIPFDGQEAKVYTQNLKKADILKTNNTVNFADYFNKIVAFYYTDEILDGSFDELTWKRFDSISGKGTVTYTDENDNKITATPGNTLNYCEVKYHEYVKDENGNYVLDENGNRTLSDKESTVYLNYKISNNNNNKADNKNPYQGIVIFEKTDHLVIDSKDVKTSEIEELNDKGFVVNTDANGEATRILIKDEEGIGKVDLKKSVETKLYDEDLKLSDTTDEAGIRTVKTVDEDSEENVSYAFADGKVTKSVEKGVTVTTYTNETLAALDKSKYSVTEDEAKEAFAKALTDKLNLLNDGESLIINVNGNDKAVTKGTEITKENAAAYGFVKAEDNEASGVFDVKGTFTKSVIVSKECKNDGESKKFVAEYNYKDGLFSPQQDHKLADGNAVNYDGNTVTVEYEDLSSVTVPSGIVNLIKEMFGNKKSNEDISDTLRRNGVKIPEGSVLYDFDAFNGEILTATVYYVSGNTVDKTVAVSNENATKEEIEEAVKDALKADLGEGFNVNNLNVAFEKGTTYGYQSLSYILKKVNENAERAVVSEEVFAAVEKHATLERRNDNWYDGNIALATQKSATDDYRDVKADAKNPTGKIVNIFLDEEEEKVTDAFRNAIDNAAAEAGNYTGLLAKIENADKLINEAKAEVDALSDQLKDLTGLTGVQSKVNAICKNLEAAKEKLAAANLKKAELEKALKETENKLAKKISDLNTPVYYPNVNSDTDNNNDNEGNTEEETAGETENNASESEEQRSIDVTEDETAQGSANVSDKKDNAKDKKQNKKNDTKTASDAEKTPTLDLGGEDKQALGSAVVNDAKDTDATASEIEVEEDKETALGEAKETENDEEAKDETPAEEKETEKETGSKVDITEDETPEGAADSVDTVKPNFWWLLLILILGATGEEMYRRHRNKKKAAKEKVKNV